VHLPIKKHSARIAEPHDKPANGVAMDGL